ncbi:hypothetical protein C789_2294 [Microcystis aeruginosa FACHB-905 = DIANCHI905]|uniref:Uncharacterized protein n=1 Tax=Microcystis aeruginosa PCC 7806SL TaxID=1903187 RepID=A0AB33BMI5_MICA7|nr:hypothetical protein BH695_2323 [Microcystis aeruginosa PCC 7806SL]ELS47892.1 hypothetical protein C789_2294 [Microcystis aeruginosa FACHB-905 = DIANCHI905]
MRTFGDLSRAGVNYLIFREKYLNSTPDHSNGWHFLREKKSKSFAQQGF